MCVPIISTIFLIPAISFQISESAHFGRKERIVTKLETPTCSSPPRGGRLSAQVGRALQPQDWPVTRGESHQSWSSTGGTPRLINHFSLGLGYASQTRKQGKTKGCLLQVSKLTDSISKGMRNAHMVTCHTNVVVKLYCINAVPLLHDCYYSTHVGCRGTRQEDVNWFQLVDSFQSICYSKAGHGAKAVTVQNSDKRSSQF